MMALSLFGSFIRLILKILLLPVQAVLTVLIAMVHFASGVLGLVCGIIGGLFVLLSFTYLFASPIDWKMFLEALPKSSFALMPWRMHLKSDHLRSEVCLK